MDLHLGGVKPPFPVGIPAGRMAPAETMRSTLSVQQVGHCGSLSLLVSFRCSNSQWQLAHRYSYMGMITFLGEFFRYRFYRLKPPLRFFWPYANAMVMEVNQKVALGNKDGSVIAAIVLSTKGPFAAEGKKVPRAKRRRQ